MQGRSGATEASNTAGNTIKKKRVALSPHRSEIEGWVDEGRSDEWIASALGTSPSSVQSFRSRAGIKRKGGLPPSSPPSTGSHGSVYEGVLDQGDEGYGLWLDPAVAEDPVFAESFSGVTDIRVVLERGRIVLEPVRSVEQPPVDGAAPAAPDNGEYEPERLFGNESLRAAKDSSSATNRERGRVKFFDADKGYGFIYRPGGSEIFVHKSKIEEEDKLEAEAEVTYEVGSSQKGLVAESVRQAG